MGHNAIDMYKKHGELKTAQLFKASFSEKFLDWLTGSKENASYLCEGNFSYNIYTPDELVDQADDDLKEGNISKEIRDELDALRSFCASSGYDNVQIPY